MFPASCTFFCQTCTKTVLRTSADRASVNLGLCDKNLDSAQ